MAADPSINLRSIALAALAGQYTVNSSGDGAGGPELSFLAAQTQSVQQAYAHWSAALEAVCAQTSPQDAALLRLAGQIGLSEAELLSAALAAAVDDDLMVGRALAFLQAPVGGSRPLLGLLARTFDRGVGKDAGGSLVQSLAGGAGVRCGLLALGSPGAPLPERPVSLPLPICQALHGQEGSWPDAIIGLGSNLRVPLPPSTLSEAADQARGLADDNGANNMLVLRSRSAAEGRSVALALAGELGLRPLFLAPATAMESGQLAGLGPWLLLRGLLPVFCLELAPGERKALPAIAGYGGPLLALTGPDGSIESPGGAALTWSLGVPPAAERRALWLAALSDGKEPPAASAAASATAGEIDALATKLANEHRHGSGRIAHLGRLAHQRSRMAGRSQPTAADISAVSWVGEGGGLDALAQPLTDPVPGEALVLTPEVEKELQLLHLRCIRRDGLAEGLGASATTRYHPGVRALFTGSSGTGKTLAAGWLATRMGLPLYRVDLAAVTSKYIGETEKNLAQLLARAEQAEVILLFDEADSLFAKRTDVKEANDRFANAQTNYLLQRIEYFDGITLLTSNNRSRFDPAFTRRLDAVIDFPMPGPEQRRQLWAAHLGEGHAVTPRELNLLAVEVDFSGGNIRNVVFLAAVLAQSQGRKIRYADLLAGIRAEYNKLGRQPPAGLERR
jgi:hypothetical protein